MIKSKFLVGSLFLGITITLIIINKPMLPENSPETTSHAPSVTRSTQKTANPHGRLSSFDDIRKINIENIDKDFIAELTRLANKNPDEALNWLRENATPPYSPELKICRSQVFSALGKIPENDELREKIISVLALSGTNQDVAQYFAGLAKYDVEDAIDRLKNSTISISLKDYAIGYIANNIAKVDPLKSLKLIEKFESRGQDYVECLCSIYRLALAANNPTMQDLDTIDSVKMQILMRDNRVQLALLHQNPELFVSCLEKLPITKENSSAYENALNKLFVTDQIKANEIIKEMPPGPLQSKLYSNLIAYVSDTNILAAEKIVSTLPPDVALTGAASIATSVVKKDVNKAVGYIQSISDAKLRVSLLQSAIQSIGKDHVRSMQLLEHEVMLDPNNMAYRGQLANQIAASWSASSVNESRAWVEKLNEDLRVPGTQGLISEWMKSDPIAASEWLSKQAAGPARDAGAQEILNQIKDTDPEMAEQWRKSMTPTPK